jgi:hypothetical protein
MGETGCYRCTGQERFEGAICDGCGSVADGRGGFARPEPVLSVGEPMWLLWTGDEYDQRDSKDDAVIRFDAIVQEMESDAWSDGEWPEDAESAPVLWVAYPLQRHTLVPDVDEDGADVSRSEVVEYADPVATLTAERDQARAERDAAQDTAAQAIADFDRVVRERDEARTVARNAIREVIHLAARVAQGHYGEDDNGSHGRLAIALRDIANKLRTAGVAE